MFSDAIDTIEKREVMRSSIENYSGSLTKGVFDSCLFMRFDYKA